jgi:hypothetical protein
MHFPLTPVSTDIVRTYESVSRGIIEDTIKNFGSVVDFDGDVGTEGSIFLD